MKIKAAIIFILVIIGLVAYLLNSLSSQSLTGSIALPLVATTVYPKMREVDTFELVNHHQQVFNNESLKGKWSVVFFGFTYCPDICPTTMAALAQVANKLTPEHLQKVQFVFVSVDPERDDVARLAEYIPFYHPDFIAVTGDREQLLALSMSLGAAFMKLPAEGGYTMSHSGTVFIVNPEAKRFGVFNKNDNGALDSRAIAQDIQSIVLK